MVSHIVGSSLAAPRIGVRSTVGSVLAALVNRLLLWQERSNERMKLLEMDDHMLKDIGISRAAAAREADKAFWRP